MIATPAVWIDELQVYPNLAGKTFAVKGRLGSLGSAGACMAIFAPGSMCIRLCVMLCSRSGFAVVLLLDRSHANVSDGVLRQRLAVGQEPLVRHIGAHRVVERRQPPHDRRPSRSEAR